MACQVQRDENSNITRVTAPNGSTSILFKEVSELIPDKEQALRVWAQAYTPSFKLTYGDWEKLDRLIRIDPGSHEIEELAQSVKVKVDDNGEPLMQYLELPDVEPKDNNSLRNKVENFLASIGVSVEVIDNILPNNVIGQADLLNRTIKVVRDLESPTTLPEEAAHFYVRLLSDDSSLKRDMFNAVTSTQIYKDVLRDYSKIPSYQTNGKPNFSKLKEEAVGKMITLAMVNPSQIPSQSINTWKSLWDRLLQYLRSLFRKTNLNQNPFVTASEHILNSQTEGIEYGMAINARLEEGILYQLSSSKTPEQNFDDIKSISDRIVKKLTDRTDPETGKKIEGYFIDGKEILKRVTNLVKAFYKTVFPNRNIDEAKRELYNLQAEKGTDIHADIEDIENRLLGEDGKLRSSILPQTNQPRTSKGIYGYLEAHIITRLTELVKKYGPDTRFLTEVKVYDPTSNIAGTIDLLVIKPNGRVDIYDWKSSDFNGGSISKGMPWYKEEAYSIQLDEYSRILKTSYGIDTDLKRAIPIRAIFNQDPKTKKYTNLTGIEMGSSIIQNIPAGKEYLLPVPSRSEKTGIKEIDNILDKLRSFYDTLQERKVTVDEKYIKSQELDKLKRAINSIQLNSSLSGLVSNGLLLIDNVQKAINAGSLTIPLAQTYFREMQLYTNLSAILPVIEKEKFGEPLSSDEKNIIADLQFTAITQYQSLKDYILKQGEQIANAQGVQDIQQVEKNVGFWGGMVRSISNAATKTVRTFYKYLTDFQDEILVSQNKANDELKQIKNNLTKWANSKSISAQKMFDGILEIDDKGRWNGGFIYKYSSEFRIKKKQFIEDRDSAAVAELLDLSTEAEAKFRKRQQSFREWLDKTTFSTDQSTNAQIKERRWDDWNFQYNVFDPKYKSTALLNYNNGVEGKSIYHSAKWKALQLPENAPLKEAYDYFQKLLNNSQKLGLIDNNGRWIPNVENDKIDMWRQYGITSILNLKGLFESFEYKTNTTFGEIDPITGKPKRSIPKLFLQNLGTLTKDDVSGEEYMNFDMKSKDLFTVFSLWNKHTLDYQYMSKLEEIGHLMLTVEELKGTHLHRDRSGKFIEATGNQENVDYLDDFINYYVYGRRLKDTNPWEFELFGKHYSGKSIVQGAIRYMSLKQLSFNTLSIAANYAGGKFNTFFVATKNKFFNKKDWAHGEYGVQTDKGKALINYFDIILEDESYRKSKQLSVYESVKLLNYDSFFIGQRLTDQWVQYPVLVAMTKSYGVIDGNIVNIKEYVQDKYNYKQIFNLPINEQKELNKKIDDEVNQLKETISIWNLSKIVGEGKNAKIEIPGVTRDNDSVLKFRNAVKRANKAILGNSTTDDISRYRMTLLGQALGQFRNWMPPMIDERFGELRYNIDTETWELGKFRSYFNNYFSATPQEQTTSRAIVTTLAKHVGVLVKDLVGFTSLADQQERAKILYAKAKAAAVEASLPFDISEHEFIQIHMNNIRSMINELRVIITFTALIFALASAGDDKEKGIGRYVSRMMDKFSNELLFYYVPTNFTQLVQAPFPVVGLFEDIAKFFQNLAGEGYATFTDNEELKKKYKPTRYIMKDVPLAREVYTLGTIFDEDMRKAYGVTK